MDLIWDAKKTTAFRRRLLSWYDRRRRTLPWRDDPTPYRVWISEIMLQQTQTETVLRYYDRFLQRFPDVTSLAAASEAEVLQFWAGLGYYRRARNLHRAARQIAATHKPFPKEFNTILELPGIGRYTAGAICSIAFNRPYPIVDGNIRRVVSRLSGLRERVPESYFWNVMASWLSQTEPASFNQGMMELGALICAPVRPRCPECPVSRFCQTRKSGAPAAAAVSRPVRSVKRIRIVTLVLEYRASVLVFRMKGRQLIPGEWGLPWRVVADSTTAEEIACALCREFLGRDVALSPLPPIGHTIMSSRIRVSGFYARLDTRVDVRSRGSLRWMRPSSARKFLTSSLFHKVLARTENPGRPRRYC